MVIKLTDGLQLIFGENTGGFPYSNSLLITGETRALVDAGAGVNILKDIAEQGIETLILSHFHPDHGRDAYLFKDSQRWVHIGDAPAVADRRRYKEFRNYQLPGNEGLMAIEEASPLGKYPHSPVARAFTDGEELDFGKGARVTVVHTPGHTAGHCCFYEVDREILYAADVDAGPFGPWYGDEVSDIDDFIHSVDKIIELRPKLLVPGHGKPVTENIMEKLTKYIRVIDRREDDIIQFLAEKPSSLDDLVGQGLIYRRMPAPGEIFRLFEKGMLQKHLQRLLRFKEVTVDGDLYYTC
ncbi:MBL fold metallo-hydrolase [Metallumcola ferriviriculae]|uniref:MBL fold metallo-hydrolase n=1 Tax=Metallumcola ferriviriculae TaxID=3039180 RepID=A0AAU0UR22_9FIRM|nr:MBL fold metallo-hydrolase [Desulfitibacteraceae bacterium MK1]